MLYFFCGVLATLVVVALVGTSIGYYYYYEKCKELEFENDILKENLNQKFYNIS